MRRDDPNKPLTKGQKARISELNKIVDLTRTDYLNIAQYEPEARTPVLEHMKQKIIRGHIVDGYVFIDELLGVIICHHFFGKKKGFIKLWKTKKFRNFNYHVLESLSLLRKLALARDIVSIDNKTIDRIKAVNAVRNAIAHLFFPENKSEYKRRKKVTYGGKDVFSLDGLRNFEDDLRAINESLFPHAYGVRLEDQTKEAEATPAVD